MTDCDSSMNVLSLIIGILGLVATLAGTYFGYISFVNPMVRFNKYLKKPSNWEKFIGIESHIYFYRYKRYPNFQIVIDWDKVVVENFHEEWINDAMFPDKTNNMSRYVQLVVNGMLLEKEVFVSLDGHRYFVPVPRTAIPDSGSEERIFYYDERQIQLVNIIGKFYFDGQDIYDFVKKQAKPIDIK